MACPPWALFPSKALRPMRDRSRISADDHPFDGWGIRSGDNLVCPAPCSRRRATFKTWFRRAPLCSVLVAFVPTVEPSRSNPAPWAELAPHRSAAEDNPRSLPCCHAVERALDVRFPVRFRVAAGGAHPRGDGPSHRGLGSSRERTGLSRCQMASRSVSLFHFAAFALDGCPFLRDAPMGDP